MLTASVLTVLWLEVIEPPSRMRLIASDLEIFCWRA
jgi:hypothetical protein